MEDITKATPLQSLDGFTFDLQRFGYPKIGNLGFDTTDNAYTISTAADLQALATYVNAGNNCSGFTFKLANDITLDTVAEGESNFTPIGNYNNQFQGTFDGDNHTISNLTISGSNSYVGLFGCVGTGGAVQNVTLTNAAVKGYSCVGVLVGGNYGTVSGNTAFSTVSGAEYVGGLVGYNESGTVTDNTFCSNYGAINNRDDSSNTRLYTLAEPDGVTAEFTGGDDYKVTINGTTYYKEGATFTLTVTESNYPDGKFLKGATFNNVTDGTYTFAYTIGTDLAWAEIPKIGDLEFDRSINVFKISSVADLQALATYVNAGNDCSGLTFKLTANITLDTVAEGESNFTPIGTYDTTDWIPVPFSGTFDGDGYTISNLTISGSNDNVGLFGYVGTGGTVKNVTLDNAKVSGNSYVGALVGFNEGGTVNDCTVSGTVTGTGGFVGGLVGLNGFTVENSTAIATVSGAEYVGGLVGQNEYGMVSGNTSISTVSGTGNYIGGIVGFNSIGGTVTDNTFCSNYGAINNRDDSSNTRLYTLAEPDGVTAEFTSGDDYKVTINGTTYYKSGATFKLTVTNFPDGQYLKGATADDGNHTYTMSNTALEWADIPTIEGLTFYRSIGAFKISTANELQALATYVNAGNDVSGWTFKLTANITLDTVAEGESNWTPIGNDSNQFAGTFDGGGHTISNLTISGSNSYVGLFGYVGQGGTVKNVALTDVNVSGNYYVGGLVGYNEGGTVSNATVSGNTVSGKSYVGGLVGKNEYGSTISYSTVDNVSVTATENESWVGGLVGYSNYGTISGNTVSGVTVTATGNYGIEGGLVGYNESGTFIDNTVDVKITVGEESSVGGLVGDNYGGTVAGNIVVSEITAGDNSYVGGGVGRDDINSSTVKNNFFHSTANDIVGYFDYSGGNENITDNNPLFAVTVPDGVKVSGDGVKIVGGKYYAAGSVTLTATDTSKVLKNITLNDKSDDDGVFTITEDTTVSADIVTATFDDVFSNGGKSVVVGGTTGNFGANSGVYSITASQQNSTLTGNNNNNTIVLEGGGENILTGGGGNDTYKFSKGGGIVTDFGIGATKDSNGKALEAPLGSDIIKLGGKVSGVYFDRDASTKKSATFTAIVTYDSTKDGDTQIIVLKDINKKPTKYGSNPVYQTNDAAAATLKIWDTSGGSSKVLSASKLKALFHDDSELSALSETVQTQLVKLNSLEGVGNLNLPAVDQLSPSNTQATYGGDGGTK